MFGVLELANNNRLIWGLTMLLMNLGAKYLSADLGKAHEKLLNNALTKKMIIFSLFFVATRDIILSFLLTILYVVIIDGLLHESSKYCVVPQKIVTGQQDNSAVNTYKYNIEKLTNVFP